MSLRWKIFLIPFAFVLIYAALTSLILFRVILPSFFELERQEAQRGVWRLAEQIGREVQGLNSMCAGWSSGNQILEFASEPDSYRRAASEKTSLDLLWFRYSRLNMLFVVGVEGDVRWGRVYQRPEERAPEVVELPEFPAGKWPQDHPLLARARDLEPVSGLVATSLGPMIVSSHPIKDTAQAGPPATLVMGRLLTDTFWAQIQSQAKVRGEIRAIQSDRLSLNDASVLERVAAGTPVVYEEDAETLRATITMSGTIGEPALLVQSATPRFISSRGRSVVLFALLSTLMIAAIIFLVVLVLLRWAVVKPLRVLTGHVTEIASQGELRPLAAPRRADEIGVLTHEFDQMVRRLNDDRQRMSEAEETAKKSQAEALKARHLASLGELSASLAHEIRNPLTGISTAVQVLRRMFSESDDHRALMDDVLENLERVERIVQRRLVFSRSWKPSKQLTDLQALTAQVCAEARARQLYRGVDFRLEESGKLEAQADPALLEQVLWNLVQNSAEAMPAEGPREIICRFDETADWARIILADTAGGMPAGVREEIFSPFFTTKKNGTGLGLIVCKNIVEAHGGTIALDNSGLGTQVVVELPKGK